MTVLIGSVFQTGTLQSTVDRAGQSEFVILDNDQVIAGRVEREGDTTIVWKDSGSRIVFENRRVKCVCRSQSELYWQKCAMLSATDIDGHLRMFHWCMEHELTDEARNQIDLLQSMSVPPAKLLELNQLLLSAVQRRERQQELDEYERQFAITDLPMTLEADAKIRTVNYESEVITPGDPSAAPFNRGRYLRQLDDVTDSLPPETVVMFKRTIEPLIINSCLTAKCHGSNSTVMPLAVINKSKSNPKRLRQRNLMEILKYTDVNRPLDSELLAAAVLPHAGQAQPILELDSRQSRSLQLWLAAISAAPGKRHALPDKFLAKDLPVAHSGKSIEPQRAPTMIGTAKIPGATKGNGHPRILDHRGSKEKAAESPDDPFDPEVFNRRYLKDDD